MIVNERGQIIGDAGITWLRDSHGYWSYDPHGYFIERNDDFADWMLFRKTSSSLPEKVPYVKQVLLRGTLTACMRVAEIYQVRRV